MIKVAIAEDVQLTAEIITDILHLSEGVKVVWCVKNGKEVIQKLEENDAVDVLLLDINMPEMDGIEAARIVSSKWKHIKIVMSTVHDDDENVFNAILAGACGYLVKDKSPNFLHKAIVEAVNGGVPMTPGIALKVLQFVRQSEPVKSTEIEGEDFGITPREKEILEHLVKGATYEQISKALFISLGTVRKHIEKIYRKLQVNNKVEAINKAQSNRLL
ncbi:MAG: response regulator transcription factor [Chitinophagales bacterium]|nr:response regulator transcription factor [Chitinophagales bacterium]